MQNRLPEKIERCISDSGKVESGENIGVTLVVALFKLRQIGDKQFEHIVFVLFFCLNRSEQTVHRMNDLAVHQTEQFFDFIFLLLSVCRAGKIEAEILEHSRQIVHIRCLCRLHDAAAEGCSKIFGQSAYQKSNGRAFFQWFHIQPPGITYLRLISTFYYR